MRQSPRLWEYMQTFKDVIGGDQPLHNRATLLRSTGSPIKTSRHPPTKSQNLPDDHLSQMQQELHHVQPHQNHTSDSPLPSTNHPKGRSKPHTPPSQIQAKDHNPYSTKLQAALSRKNFIPRQAIECRRKQKCQPCMIPGRKKM